MPEDHNGSETPSESPGVAGDDAALDRLRALSADDAGQSSEPKPQRRTYAESTARSSPQRRPAAARRGGRNVARIAAPAVFLVAILIVVTMLFQSGVIGGGSEAAVSPSPKASATKGGKKATTAKGTKVYVVKTGDTLSGIAVKFDTTTSALEDLNPNLSGSTLGAGVKIKVPRN
ncbi:MAG TPA: LysM domain-containing protein [Thermoleophilia bacterium]|nr:LysM domain-containing protein [Thermoleophilia bacterium]